MLAIAVLCFLASALASLCVTHMRLTGRMDNGRLAANAARSTASIAIAKILEQPEFGKTRKPTDEVRYTGADSSGLVTFNKDSARANGIRMSTNNLKGTSDIAGDGNTLVPSGTIELSVLGQANGTQRTLDVVLRIPPFPWAIASAGRIVTKNGVLVAALPEGVWPPPTDPTKLLPADLVANANQGPTIILGNRSLVLGDVETPGRVELGASQVEVRGEIRDGAEPVDLPTLQPSDYDPETTNVDYFEITDGDVQEIVGTARAADDVTFANKLKLSSGTLYVDGDLTLLRGVEGNGALIATGNITVKEGAQFDGLTELAIVSGARVKLAGVGERRSAIRGLFYAEQGLEASELTLAGSLLTGGASTGVDLDHVNVYHQTPSGEGTIPSGTYHIGSYRPSAGGPPTVNPPGTGLTPTTIPLPGGYLPLFTLTLAPTNGGYPLTVTIVSGLGPVQIGPTVLTDQAALEEFREQAMERLQQAWSGLPFLISSEGYDVMNQMSTQLHDIGQGEDGAPSVLLTGDISLFLPLEDRVRVVSWVEH